MNDDREDHRKLAIELVNRLEKEARVYRLLSNRDDWQESFEQHEQQMREDPLCVDRIVTYRVTLGTGGPACGVDWDDNGNAQAWWQDWFTGKTFVDLDDDTASTLASIWGIDEMLYEDERRDDARSRW